MICGRRVSPSTIPRLSDNQDKYIAGTQFNDSVTGENNVNNTYYYVGQDTTIGSGPTDQLHRRHRHGLERRDHAGRALELFDHNDERHNDACQ